MVGRAPRSAAALRRFLTGGDRRSIARSDRALVGVRSEPGLVSELIDLASDEDPLVSQRSLDLLEKLARERPEWVVPYKRVFIGPLADSDRWEARLQIVRALPLFEWTAAERRRVIRILTRDVAHPQTFVKAWALDSLACSPRGSPGSDPQCFIVFGNSNAPAARLFRPARDTYASVFGGRSTAEATGRASGACSYPVAEEFA